MVIRSGRFAVIVISKNYFGREWTEKELKEFLTRQNESGQKIVLPLLLGISLNELKEQYPDLGEIQWRNVLRRLLSADGREMRQQSPIYNHMHVARAMMFFQFSIMPCSLNNLSKRSSRSFMK
jgi:hypothetical protein